MVVTSNTVRCSESDERDTFDLRIFLDEVVDEDARHVVGVGQNNRRFHASECEERVDASRVSLNGI